jgi:hypothetical protein
MLQRDLIRRSYWIFSVFLPLIIRIVYSILGIIIIKKSYFRNRRIIDKNISPLCAARSIARSLARARGDKNMLGAAVVFLLLLTIGI